MRYLIELMQSKLEQLLEKKADYRDWNNLEKSDVEMGFVMEDGKTMIVSIFIKD